MRLLQMVLAVGLLLSGLLYFSIAPAVAQAVDLQLILAADASGSIDEEEWRLQLQGYAAAWRDPLVHRAIASAGEQQALAVTFVQWSGYAIQMQTVPWRRIKTATDAVAFADEILTMPRQIFGGGTSLSGIIDYALPLFQTCPFPTTRRIIDISGDGANRNGRSASAARDEAIGRGIVINGLPILGSEANLDQWYQDNVVGGPGAFMVVAKNFASFAEAIRQKLIREIAWQHKGAAGNG